MIISCTSCNKKFEINSDLIPNNGRLLVCGSCKNQWFFKKEVINDKTTPNIIDIEVSKDNNTEHIVEDTQLNIQNEIKQNKSEKKIIKNSINENNLSNRKSNKEFNIKKIDNKVNKSILNLLLVFIISSIGLIILIDTFKDPLAIVLPNIEITLFNLYETLKDMILFFKDLIR